MREICVNSKIHKYKKQYIYKLRIKYYLENDLFSFVMTDII